MLLNSRLYPLDPGGRWFDIGAIGAATGLTMALHHVALTVVPLWSGVVEHLYSVPIVWAAMRSGVLGGLLAGLASVLAVVWVITREKVSPELQASTMAETPAFLIVGIAGGLLAAKWRHGVLQVAKLKVDLRDRSEQLARSGKLSAAGELAIGLAHELRHPVASLKGIVSLLQDQKLGTSIREECVAILGRECERMERLLSELLTFARPRPTEVAPVRANEVVDGALSLVRFIAGAAHVDFRQEIAQNVGTLLCDREQIKQVLVNLLLNSIHAMPNGGTITVRVAERGDSALLEVIDDGRGVAPELMDKIFLPFVTTRSEGTGLGLSVAKQIVSQHGGELVAERNPQRGMTFRFDLPQIGMSSS